MKKTNQRYEELELADLDVVVGGAGRTLTPPPNPLGITNEGVLAGRDAFAADAATHGGSAGVYIGFGSNVMGNGPSTVMTIGSDLVHFYESNATGVGNGASAAGLVGVWAATSPNGSAFWTGPGNSASVGAKEGAAVSFDVGSSSGGVSAGISFGAGGSVGGVAVSASSTFGTEVHPFGETPQAGAPGTLANQAGSNDIASHPDAPGASADQAGSDASGSHPDGGTPGDHSGDQGTSGSGDHSGELGASGSGAHGADLAAGPDHGNDAGTGASGTDHSNDSGAGYRPDSNFGNDFGGSDFGGSDFGGSDFG
jgi:hypothetical protein